jgi:hypothetical protein
LIQVLFNFLVLGDASFWVALTEEEEEEEAPSSSPKQIKHSTNTVVRALIVLNCMVKKHVSMSLDSPN